MVSLPSGRGTVVFTFYAGVARSRSGSSSFTDLVELVCDEAPFETTEGKMLHLQKCNTELQAKLEFEKTLYQRLMNDKVELERNLIARHRIEMGRLVREYHVETVDKRIQELATELKMTRAELETCQAKLEASLQSADETVQSKFSSAASAPPAPDIVYSRLSGDDDQLRVRLHALEANNTTLQQENQILHKQIADAEKQQRESTEQIAVLQQQIAKLQEASFAGTKLLVESNKLNQELKEDIKQLEEASGEKEKQLAELIKQTKLQLQESEANLKINGEFQKQKQRKELLHKEMLSILTEKIKQLEIEVHDSAKELAYAYDDAENDYIDMQANLDLANCKIQALEQQQAAKEKATADRTATVDIVMLNTSGTCAPCPSGTFSKEGRDTVCLPCDTSVVICEPGPKPPIVPEPRPPDPGPDLPSIVTPAPRPVVPVLDSSTILPYVVKVAVELPLSREEFNSEKQEDFRLALAEVFQVDQSWITIANIRSKFQRRSRRLLEESIIFDVLISTPEKSTAESVAASMTIDTINVALEKACFTSLFFA